MNLRMGNPETLSSLGTQDRGQRQTKQKTNTTQKTKMGNMDPTSNQGVNPGTQEGKQFLLLIRTH